MFVFLKQQFNINPPEVQKLNTQVNVQGLAYKVLSYK